MNCLITAGGTEGDNVICAGPGNATTSSASTSMSSSATAKGTSSGASSTSGAAGALEIPEFQTKGGMFAIGMLVLGAFTGAIL